MTPSPGEGDSGRPSVVRRSLRPRVIGVVAAVVAIVTVVLAIKATKTQTLLNDCDLSVEHRCLEEISHLYLDLTEPFDASRYFTDEIEPSIERSAVDLATLVEAIQADEEKAKLDYGNSDNPLNHYSYPVTFTGVAGEATGQVTNDDGSLSKTTIPFTVDGLSVDVQVELQIALLRGSALRDVTGTINFNQVSNQSQFQVVSQNLNDIVEEHVISPFFYWHSVNSLEGETLKIVGAFTDDKNLEVVSVVPISIELVSLWPVG